MVRSLVADIQSSVKLRSNIMKKAPLIRVFPDTQISAFCRILNANVPHFAWQCAHMGAIFRFLRRFGSMSNSGNRRLNLHLKWTVIIHAILIDLSGSPLKSRPVAIIVDRAEPIFVDKTWLLQNDKHRFFLHLRKKNQLHLPQRKTWDKIFHRMSLPLVQKQSPQEKKNMDVF